MQGSGRAMVFFLLSPSQASLHSFVTVMDPVHQPTFPHPPFLSSLVFLSESFIPLSPDAPHLVPFSDSSSGARVFPLSRFKFSILRIPSPIKLCFPTVTRQHANGVSSSTSAPPLRPRDLLSPSCVSRPQHEQDRPQRRHGSFNSAQEPHPAREPGPRVCTCPLSFSSPEP